MDFQDLIDFGKRFSDMSCSVRKQFENLMAGIFVDLNPDAISEIRTLTRFHKDIESRLKQYDEWLIEYEKPKHRYNGPGCCFDA